MNWTVRQLIELTLFPLLLAVGQVLFKRAAGQASGSSGMAWALELARLPAMWMAFVLYCVATLLWVRILAEVPLGRAYPFMALAFIVVPAGGYLFFNEAVTLQQVLGTVLIIIGVIVVARA